MTDVNNAMSLTHAEMLANEFVFTVHDCPVDKVVVYLDRAEVRRVVNATIKKGQNEIILKNLSSCIDEDSIR